MSCCPVTAVPAVAGHDFRGAITYGQASIYVTGPSTAKAGILAFSNIFGPDSGRTQQDADDLGRLGYVVVLVDLAAGEYPIPETYLDTWHDWLKLQDFESVLLPRIQDAMAYLKTEAHVTSFASYGYCWGGWVGAHLSTLAMVDFKGHVSFHPSWQVENMLHGEGSVEKLARRIVVPQLLLSACDDCDFLQAHGSVHQILTANLSIAALSDVVDFPDMHHGWVNRGDLSDEAVRAGVQKAWHAAINFLQNVNPPY